MKAETRVLNDRYRVDELIGRGGMASVFRGFDEKLGRTVAIKILEKDLAGDSTFRTRFRLEAQAASRMAHSSIVRVFDAGEDTETDATGGVRPVPYIVMELVTGTLLKDIIARGPVAPKDAVRYADGILEALEYSHRAGVVHRDIKPGNVMITESGQVKVMDFGIARAVSDSSSTVAQTTAILGTAAYFSPEQAKGESVDARADLYSTGVVLYELLTGRPPFRGDSPVAVAYQHVSETPVTPTALNPDVPKGLDPVVLRALAKDPFQRYQDAARFREALDAALDGRAPTKRELDTLTNELYGPSPRQAQETARTLQQLSSDTTMTRTQSGPPVVWIWSAVALIAVLIVALVFWLATIRPWDGTPSTARIIPDVAGMTYEKAVEELEARDLVPVREDVPSDSVPEGVVVETDPGADLSVSPNQRVEVLVSEGPEVAVVPALVGLTESQARDAISKAGLSLGAILPVDDAEHKASTVLRVHAGDDEVAEGDELPAGATIDLEVATGRVQVNDLKGFSLDAAKRALEELGLTAEVVEDDTCQESDQPGVVSQSEIGSVPIQSTIRIRVCTGSEPTPTPTPTPTQGIDADPAER
ncbi:serine/threonine-protein kinase PknB [Microbacterium barkeri]|uniref:non-specific serine/threonine protein kinase n=1 Tax=Microbacterium barkeri TaxID=33917 RepID=A0A9W6H1F9_9MICO|nr:MULTISPECIES: Stk1 family PASTA domain-containing Ser/Thr kinase [Microbacterium]MDR6877612.1 serine/threonine-protein kinase [Microbacterium barkeri]WRH16104.1 Stk1 family PASTA domain-containing Ser/Thr kinase [Microbacterium sp. JZ37]GLJ60767.1 serine/threonine-protein kinase PknB [Microbacterium barkeri]